MSEARPIPLRVPVNDVSVRSSLSPGRRGLEAVSPAVIVVQRAVRIISDAPPSMREHNGAPPATLRNGHDLEVDETADTLELDEEVSLRIDAALVDERIEEPADDEPEEEEEDDEPEVAEVLEVSVPPPAPPAALLRTIEPKAKPVAVESAQPLDEDEDDLEVEASTVSGETRVPSPPPPPPPPAVKRPSLPEPSDLSALVSNSNSRVQELRPTKPRSHAWWEVFFDDDYLRTVRPPSRQDIARQCDFIESRLGLKPGATLLDVGCGLGHHVVELSARGVSAVGVDLSLAMLSRASEEAQQRNLKINFLHADMRELAFDGNFDAVTCLGTSLGYFDDETNKKVMDRLLRALKPGGVLLMDVVNRDYVIRAQPNLIWFEGDGCVCMEESEFNYFTSRLHVKRTVILDSGKQLEHEYSLRLYSLHELGQLMNSSGFRVSEVSGRDALPGVFFGHESPNLMIVAQRRPADS